MLKKGIVLGSSIVIVTVQSIKFVPNECGSNFGPFRPPNPYADAPQALIGYEFLRCLHFSCAIWPFLAVVRVNSAPQLGHVDFAAAPDFSR
jgi:hypothetical protein